MPLYDLNRPQDLFQLLLKVFSEYESEPSEKDFLLLAMGLNHLREWICDTPWKMIESKLDNNIPLTPEEKFFDDIYELPSFKIVNELCNRSKHGKERLVVTTTKTSGAQMGLVKMGDSLGQNYFLINGNDSRDYFFELIAAYAKWFNRKLSDGN